VQIEDYSYDDYHHRDKNPFVHSPEDNIAHINAGYLLKQMQATAAFAGQLAEPVMPEYQVSIPFLWH
jgi:hypothetical protein